MHLSKESENKESRIYLNVSRVKKNSQKINEEKFVLNGSAVPCGAENIVTFINRI